MFQNVSGNGVLILMYTLITRALQFLINLQNILYYRYCTAKEDFIFNKMYLKHLEHVFVFVSTWLKEKCLMYAVILLMRCKNVNFLALVCSFSACHKVAVLYMLKHVFIALKHHQLNQPVQCTYTFIFFFLISRNQDVPLSQSWCSKPSRSKSKQTILVWGVGNMVTLSSKAVSFYLIFEHGFGWGGKKPPSYGRHLCGQHERCIRESVTTETSGRWRHD